MKKITLLCLLMLFIHGLQAANIRIIESQSMTIGHDMDQEWDTVITSMGHTPIISPQTTLDNNAFFASTDALIISSGVIALSPARVNTILQFLQTGKPVYLQCEYQSSYTTNIAFAQLVTTLGGVFNWNSTVSGQLTPMNILGTFATNNIATASINYYWYSVSGTAGCGVTPFLLHGGLHHGFQYNPPNTSIGTLICTTDQDWVRTTADTSLMQNIVTHLLDTTLWGIGSNSAISVNLGPDTSFCQGQNHILAPNMVSATYLWQDGSTNDSLIVTTSGTYYVTVNNACGSGSDTITLTADQPQTISLGNDTTFCQGGSILLDASQTTGAYQWQDGSSGSTQMVTSSGLYWVDVLTACGNVSDSINVTVMNPPTGSIGPDTTICQGNQVTLSSPTGNWTTQWSDGSTMATLSTSQSGTYWVSMSNQCGTHVDSMDLTVQSTPLLNLGNDTTFCQGGSMLLNGTQTSGTYQWQDGSTGSTLTVTSSGLYWVDVLTTCGNASDSINITVMNPPTGTIGPDTTICQGNQVTLSAPTGNWTNQWSDGSSLTTFTTGQAGIFWVSLSNMCGTHVDSMDLTVQAIPVPDLGSDTTFCSGDSLLLFPGVSGASYTWNTGASTPSASITSGGTFWVDVTLNGCTARDSIFITENPIPVFYLGNDTLVCAGEMIPLSSPIFADNYLWQDGSSGINHNISTPGIYWLEATLSGCNYRDSIEVFHKPAPEVDLGNNQQICEGDTVIVTATTNGNLVTWQDGSSGDSLIVTTSQVVWVEVILNGCTNRDSILVVTELPFEVSLGNDREVCPQDPATFDLTGQGDSFLWDDGSVLSSLSTTDTGVVYVTVWRGGCTASDTVLLTEGHCGVVLQMPNVFTPNGDGSNDLFLPVVAENVNTIGFRIFNRWGLEMFSSADVTTGWNGDGNNGPVSAGTYFWMLDYSGPDGNVKSMKGVVTLLR